MAAIISWASSTTRWLFKPPYRTRVASGSVVLLNWRLALENFPTALCPEAPPPEQTKRAFGPSRWVFGPSSLTSSGFIAAQHQAKVSVCMLSTVASSRIRNSTYSPQALRNITSTKTGAGSTNPAPLSLCKMEEPKNVIESRMRLVSRYTIGKTQRIIALSALRLLQRFPKARVAITSWA
jgi:hypothetical protein